MTKFNAEIEKRCIAQDERLKKLEERERKNCELIEYLLDTLNQTDNAVAIPMKLIRNSDSNKNNSTAESNVLLKQETNPSSTRNNKKSKSQTAQQNIPKIRPENQKNKSNKKSKKWGEIKLAWDKLITTASIHGLPRIMKTNKYSVKFVWIIMILASTLCGVFTVINTYRDFLKFDVITQTKKMEEKSITFPAVTFCNLKYESFELIELITSCQYDSRTCEYTKDFDHLTLSEGMYSLKCIRFNGYKNSTVGLERTEGTDHTNGLLIDFALKDNQDTLLTYITDNYLNSFERVTSLLFSTQNIYNIYIKKSVEKKLEMPYNTCKNIKNETYRQLNCINRCTHFKIDQKYQCSFPGFYSYSHNEKRCHDIDKKTHEFHHICQGECPKECDSMSFDLTVTSNTIKGNMSNKVINFGAFFSDFSYLEITQVPKMTGATLISSIGGTLALFIGIRFLSIVEIIEFFIDVIYVLLKV